MTVNDHLKISKSFFIQHLSNLSTITFEFADIYLFIKNIPSNLLNVY